MVGFVEAMVVGTFIVSEAVLIASSSLHYVYSFISLLTKPTIRSFSHGHPKVSIQIPVYNEGDVVRRSIEAAIKLDWPEERKEIIVVDDSTDETSEIVAEYPVKHIKRKKRKGFKAGALNEALEKSDGEFIAVFDADFEPEPAFLKKTVAAFDGNTAVVQGRWKYRNEDESLIARVASIMCDAFYEVVMKYRSAANTVIFSGSGGVIRKAAIEGVGGWNEKSISEDLDLSIRLLCEGWDTYYLENAVSTGEAPSTLSAFAKQQSRWSFGTSEVALKYFWDILSSPQLGPFQKADLLSSSMGFFVTPIIVLLYLAGFLNSLARWLDPDVLVWVVITLATLGYFFELITASVKSRKKRNLLYMPAVFFVLALLNFPLAKGVIDAVLGKEKAFDVTPKSGL